MISKIGGTCRNIQLPGGDVFGEFFQIIMMWIHLFAHTLSYIRWKQYLLMQKSNTEKVN